MTVAEIIALCAALISLGGLALNVRSNKQKEIQNITQRVAERTETNMKLDEIGRNVSEIKEVSKETTKSLQALSDKIAVVDAKAEKAHLRIDMFKDELEGLEKRVEQKERKEHKT